MAEKIYLPGNIYTIGIDCPIGFYMYCANMESPDYNNIYIDVLYAKTNQWIPISSSPWSVIYLDETSKQFTISGGKVIFLGSEFDFFQHLENEHYYINSLCEIKLLSVISEPTFYNGDFKFFVHKQWFLTVNNHPIWAGILERYSGYRMFFSSYTLEFAASSCKDDTIYKHPIAARNKYDFFTQEKHYIDATSSKILDMEKIHCDKKWTQIAIVEIPELAYDDVELITIANRSPYRSFVANRSAGFTIESSSPTIQRLWKCLEQIQSYGINIDIKSIIRKADNESDNNLSRSIAILENIIQNVSLFPCRTPDTSRLFTFHIGATYDKAYYCGAKLAQSAKSVSLDDDRPVYYVTFSGRQVDIMILMYSLFAHDNEERPYMREIAEYLACQDYIFYIFFMLQINIDRYISINSQGYVLRGYVLTPIYNAIKNQWKSRTDKLYQQMKKENRIPTKWVNEYRLYRMIQQRVSNAIYQYRADWLDAQSLDIYLPTRKIGIEYQGEQHYKSIDFFGGEADYIYRQELDNIKKTKAAQNGIKLLYWPYEKSINENSVDAFIKENGIRPYKDKEDIAMKTPAPNGIDMAPILNLPSHETEHKETDLVIRKYNTAGDFLSQYNNISEASAQNDISVSSIWKCLNGQRNVAGGFIWKRESRQNSPMQINPVTSTKPAKDYQPKPIEQYDKNGNLIQTFPSIRSASTSLQINVKSISDALNGRQKSAGGYIWKYSR